MSILLALLLGLPAAIQAPPQAPDPAEVIAAYKEATGGAAWDRIEGSTEAGTQARRPYRTWVRYTRYGTRLELGTGAERITIGYNGSVLWGREGAGTVREGTLPADLGAARTSAFANARGYFFPHRFAFTTRYLREAREDGRLFDVIEIVPAGGQAADYWFDRETHLLARIAQREGPTPERIEYDIYLRVGALLVPHRYVVLSADGGTTIDEQIAATIAFGPLEPELFDPPGRD